MLGKGLWTLNRLVVLALVGGFIMLVLEIRSDHRDVLGEQPLSWTPIIFSLVMIPVGLLGVGFWRRGGRQVLMVGFALSLLVGLAGFYFHNRKHPVRRIDNVLAAWTLPVRNEEQERAERVARAQAQGRAGSASRSRQLARRHVGPRDQDEGETRTAPGRRNIDEDEDRERPPREDARNQRAPGSTAQGASGLKGAASPAVVPFGPEDRDTGPPVLAPLSFVGLGLIGVLACLGALQQGTRGPTP